MAAGTLKPFRGSERMGGIHGRPKITSSGMYRRRDTHTTASIKPPASMRKPA